MQWLKLIGAILLVFAAIYLPAVAAETSASVLAVSAALSAVGGALLGDALSTQKRYIKSIAPRLNSINRLLATITSQISGVIVEEKRECGGQVLCFAFSANQAWISTPQDLTPKPDVTKRGLRGRGLRFTFSENQVQINKTQGPALKAHGMITLAGFLPSGWQCSGNPVGCRLGAEACCWRFWERESHLP